MPMNGAAAMPTPGERLAAPLARADRDVGRLQLAVQIGCRSRRLPPAARLRASVRRWVCAALAADGAAEARITVRFVTRREARALNARFLARDYAPNVLSFPDGDARGRRGPCGDIAVCPAVVAADAREQGRAFGAQLAHMVVHGVLHLGGHDHLRPAQAARMQGVESRALRALGFADPWRGASPDSPAAVVSTPRTRLSSARATISRRRPTSGT